MVVLETTEISGLTLPLYNSGATNKLYVDTISGSLLGNYYPSTLGKGVSGAVSNSINWYNESSQKLSDISGSLAPARIWYAESSSKLSDISGSIIGKYYPSTLGKQVSGAVAPLTEWYGLSSQKLSDISGSIAPARVWYIESSQKLSGWFGSGAQYGQIYDHTQDNTQAHSDYLLNNADDTTSGVISATGFMGILSGTKISGGNIRARFISGTYYSGSYLNVITISCATFNGPSVGGASTLDDLTDVTISTPRSGQVLQYYQKDAQWKNVMPPMTFSIANIRISAQQNINLVRFDCEATQKAYVWQASACGSGGAAISGMYIQMLAGSTLPLDGSNSIYKTSSQILQQGYPLGASATGDHVEIRFMYSGTNVTGIQYGTGFMNLSVL